MKENLLAPVDTGAALQFFLQFRVVVKMKENEFIPKEMSANQRRISSSPNRKSKNGSHLSKSV